MKKKLLCIIAGIVLALMAAACSSNITADIENITAVNTEDLNELQSSQEPTVSIPESDVTPELIATPEPTATPEPRLMTATDYLEYFSQEPAQFEKIYTDNYEQIDFRILTYESAGSSVHTVVAEDGHKWYRFWLEVGKVKDGRFSMSAAWADYGCIADGKYIALTGYSNMVGLNYAFETDAERAAHGYGFVQIPESAKDVWLVYNYDDRATEIKNCFGYLVRKDGIDITTPPLSTYYDITGATEEELYGRDADKTYTWTVTNLPEDAAVYSYVETVEIAGLQVKVTNIKSKTSVWPDTIDVDIELTVTNTTDNPIFGFGTQAFRTKQHDAGISHDIKGNTYLNAKESTTVIVPYSGSSLDKGDILLGIGPLLDINCYTPCVVIQIPQEAYKTITE